MDSMETGKIVTLVVTGAVALTFGILVKLKLLERERRPWFLSPVKSPVLRLLIALMAGGLAAYISQPWSPPPDGWPTWQATLFIGFCFFGMWGSLTLRYWAYKRVQE